MSKIGIFNTFLRNGIQMQLEPLTYVSSRDPRWKRWTMRAIEDLSGRRRLLPIYHTWRTKVAGK